MFSSLLLILISLLGGSGPSEHKSRIRTDGYYVYDNAVDTFILLPNAEALYNQTVEALKASGIYASGRPDSCMPAGKAIAKGSSFLHYLCFYNDSAGTSVAAACRDNGAVSRAQNVLYNRRMGLDTSRTARSQSLARVILFRDSVLHIELPAASYFSSELFGKAYGDSLVLRWSAPKTPGVQPEVDMRTYRFVQFRATVR